ncbi:hypothetical protein [Ideonella sp. A 288]|uniref:hypothetical protein n=1 Tax=Ideonella sp. A 288 TaxID=1962181 RepID=UPI000B4BCE81|nr:hypothetical protein [Ideonella sp. A 288]
MAFLGILMLQTRFPRLPGDVGHPATWRMPVRRAVVAGASPQRVVRERSAGLLQPFIDTARTLVDDGAAAITTSCGFLALFQHELQAALPVPVWTSSLLQLAELAPLRPGVITVDAQALSADHLRAAGAAPDTPVEGLAPGCSLQRTLLDDLPTLDERAAQADAVDAARRLLRRHPGLGALVLECTNLPPHAEAIRQATGLPVHDLTTFVHQRWAALRLS